MGRSNVNHLCRTSWLLLAAVAIVSCDNPEQSRVTSRIDGTVTDAASGAPLPGADVWKSCDAGAWVATTDEAGDYGGEVSGSLRSPAAAFAFSMPGYRSVCVPAGEAVATPDGSYRLDVNLEPAGDALCLVPLAVIDRWEDTNANGLWDVGEPYDPVLTGYRTPDDIGLQLTLKLGNPHAAAVLTIYYPVDLPPLGYEPAPLRGGDWMRTWITECAPYALSVGDSLQLEPGNMVSTVRDALRGRIARDPDAYWDDASASVRGSTYEVSPRLVTVPLSDPSYPPWSGKNHVTASSIAVVFVEAVSELAVVDVRIVDVPRAE